MRRTSVGCLIGFLLGCSGGGLGPGDLGTSLDGALPDEANADLTAAPSIYGSPCSLGNECGPGGYCLGAADDWPAGGYCTKPCTADGDCGAGAVCSSGPNQLCYPSCGANDSCTRSGQLCSQVIGGGTTDLGRKACVPGKNAMEGDPCTTFGDCQPTQACVTGSCTKQ